MAVTAQLALRPVADGEAWPDAMAQALWREQEQGMELRADGKRADDPPPHLEVEPYTISSPSTPPIPTWRIGGGRKALGEALTRARAKIAAPAAGDIVPAYEQQGDGWELRFVHTVGGFELEPGALAKLGEPDEQGQIGVVVFLAEGDGARFEQLTREHVGRRISLVHGDESLMTPVVLEPIPGGTLWITPGDGRPAELLSRLVGG